MSSLNHRKDTIQTDTGTILGPGSSYTVTVYPAAAQVASNQSGTTITVNAGHGVPAGGGKVQAFRPGSPAALVAGTFQTASSSTATTVVFPSSVTVVAGDLIVYIGTDTGSSSPNYDGSTLSIYPRDATSSALTASRVTANTDGEYEYWWVPVDITEIVRSAAAALVDVNVIQASNMFGPSALVSVDKTVARWNSTSGRIIQGSTVVIDDAGAMSGITTIATSGSITAGGAVSSTGVVTPSAGVVAVYGTRPSNVCTWPANTTTPGNDTACTNGTAYVGSVFLGANASITGIQYLIGSVGGTTKVIVSLHKADGTLVANSATAGTTVGTAATIQQVPFTAPYSALGPAWYFIALTFDSTTAKFRTVLANTNSNGVIGNSVTQTFGTPASFTAPTTFNPNVVPIGSLY